MSDPNSTTAAQMKTTVFVMRASDQRAPLIIKTQLAALIALASPDRVGVDA